MSALFMLSTVMGKMENKKDSPWLLFFSVSLTMRVCEFVIFQLFHVYEFIK